MSLILCLSPAYQPLLCSLVGRDVCVPHFVSLTGVPAFIVRSCRGDVCVPHFVSLTGVPAFIARSCRERRVCPFFHIICVTQSHLRINQPLLFYVGRVISITMR